MAAASIGAAAVLAHQSKVAQAQTDAGIVSSSAWASIDSDGSSTEGPGQQAIKDLGRPVHIECCPTGTVEFMGKGCCDDVDSVTATVRALGSKMSTHPPKFLIITGSLRKESYSRKLGVEVGRILASYGADVKLFDSEGLPLFCRDGDSSNHEKVKELRALTRWCEGMVWVSPEIHGNYSAVFKNQIDWMPLTEGSVRPTQGKTLAVMQVEGGSQSFNTVNNLRTLGRWMRCVVIPNQSSVPQAYKEFEENGTMKATGYRSRVVDVAEELFKYTLLLRDQQPYLLDRFSERK